MNPISFRFLLPLIPTSSVVTNILDGVSILYMCVFISMFLIYILVVVNLLNLFRSYEANDDRGFVAVSVYEKSKQFVRKKNNNKTKS